MTYELILRYFHILGFMALFAALVTEHMLVAKTMNRAALRRVATVDVVFGAAALIALVTGLLLWFQVGKPAEFYTKNALFHTKLTLFVVVAILSAFPTAYYLRNRKGPLDTILQTPKWVIMMIRMELTLLAAIPLLAVFMARGIGSFAS
jgi:putative membrane protein